jgi:UDP-glucuronate 4-epimerase
MSILITGAAGFIGFHLSAIFIKKKFKVIGIDNLNRYYDVNLKKSRLKILKKNKNFKFYYLDIANEKKVKQLFKKYKFKYVINLAAQAGVRYSLINPQSYLKSNLIGFFNLINSAKENNVKHFLYASTSSVYGLTKKKSFREKDTADHPIQFYAATKRSNEIIAHSYSYLYKLPTTGLRFFTVYGPWGRPDMALFRFTKNILNKKKIDVYNYGKHKRDFTYIDDIVNAIYLSTLKLPKRSKIKNDPSVSTIAPYQILNIGGGKKVSLMNFIKEIEKNLNIKSKINFLPLQKGDVKETMCNTNKIKDYLNFTTKTNYQIGIKNFINWYKAYYS